MWAGSLSFPSWEDGGWNRSLPGPVDGLCSFWRETGVQGVRPGWRSQGGQTEHSAGDLTPTRGRRLLRHTHLSPPGSITSCRTRPPLGLSFSICLLPHRPLLGYNKIMALTPLSTTINIGEVYDEIVLTKSKTVNC